MNLKALAMVMIFAVFCGCTSQQVVSNEQRALLVTEHDLSASGIPQSDGYAGNFSRAGFSDGSLSIKYRYRSPEFDGKFVLSASEIHFKPNVSASESLFDSSVAQASVSLGAQGLSVEEQPGFVALGDKTFFAVLKTRSNVTVGNFIIIRQGTKVYSLLTAGLYFDDPKDVSKLLSPKLDALANYQP